MEISGGWLDQWTLGDDAEPYLMVDLWCLSFMWRPGDALAVQWVVVGIGFWVRVDWY